MSPLSPPLLSETSSPVRNYDDKDLVGDTVRGKAMQGNSAGQSVIGEAGKEKTAKEGMEKLDQLPNWHTSCTS